MRRACGAESALHGGLIGTMIVYGVPAAGHRRVRARLPGRPLLAASDRRRNRVRRSKGFISSAEYTPGRTKWDAIRRLARVGHPIYWRVVAKDGTTLVPSDQVLSFSLTR